MGETLDSLLTGAHNFVHEGYGNQTSEIVTCTL